MSRLAIEELKDNVLVGMGRKAWHSTDGLDTLGRPNAFDTPVPYERVEKLFDWEPRILENPMVFGENVPDLDGVRHTARVEGWTMRDKKVLINPRTNKFIAVHGIGRTVTSYKEGLLDFAVALNESSDLFGIASAGCLDNGGFAWVQIETDQTYGEKLGVKFRPFIVVTDSHDGSTTYKVKPGSVLVVCENTYSMFMHTDRFDDRTYSRVHRGQWSPNVEEIQKAIGLLDDNAREQEGMLDQLLGTKITDSQWFNFLENHMDIEKDSRKWEAIDTMYRTSPMVKEWTGTAFGVSQVFSTYAHHGPRKGIDSDAQRWATNTKRGIVGQTDRLDDTVIARLQNANMLVLK